MPPPPPGPGGFGGPGPGGPGDPIGLLIACVATAFLCIWCCSPPPPPPPDPYYQPQTTVVYVEQSGPNNGATYGTATVSKPQYREIKAINYRDGMAAVRYYLTIPQDVEYGAPLEIDLGGYVQTVVIPSYINRGEKVIVIAPAP